jgi:hypothetical protein
MSDTFTPPPATPTAPVAPSVKVDPVAQAKIAQAVAASTPAPVPTRPARRPFGTIEQKLAYPPIPGFHIRWFNDTPGRIDRAKEAGFAHVNDKRNVPEKRVVGVGEGGPLHAYLMKIPQEWYDEDQRIALEQVEAVDKAIREGRPTGKEQANQMYVPADRPISIKRSGKL